MFMPVVAEQLLCNWVRFRIIPDAPQESLLTFIAGNVEQVKIVLQVGGNRQ